MTPPATECLCFTAPTHATRVSAPRFTPRATHLLVFIFALGCAAAHAAAPAPPSARVGIVDARMPDAARVALPGMGPSAEAVPGNAAPPHELRFLRLSPPAGQATECCIRPQAPVDPQETSLLRYQGADAEPAAEREARFTHLPGDGFVGLAVQGKPTVKRASSHRLLLRWPDSRQQVRVDHCLAAEGLHVKIAESTGAGRWKPAAHYYLPLGADVQPDCPRE